MKTIKITFWVSTIIIAVLNISGLFFLNSPQALEGSKHLGLPNWFNTELTIGKFIGGLILIIPFIPQRIKEWAYVALGIDILSAMIALVSVDGAKPMSFAPLIAFAILLISYISYHKINSGQKI